MARFRFISLLVLLVGLAKSASPQGAPGRDVLPVITHPSGACTIALPLRYDSLDGTLWGCDAGTWVQIGGSGASGPGGSSGQLQYNNSGAFGGATGTIYQSAQQAVGVGASQKLSAVTAQPRTSHSITGTTTANATDMITGVGTLFLTEVGIGDRITLSSDPATFCTVSAIADDTHLTLDSNYQGDSCGDGTLQTITVYPGALGLNLSSGIRFLSSNDQGHLGLGSNDFADTGTPTIPVPDTYWRGEQVLVGDEEVFVQFEGNRSSDGRVSGFAGGAQFIGAGTTDRVRGLVGFANVVNGTASNVRGVFGNAARIAGTANDLTGGYFSTTGTSTTSYGVQIGDISGGATNYAIKTGTGLVSLGDVIISTGTPPAVSGCTAAAIVAGSTALAGQVNGTPTGACVLTLTFPAAPHGWNCAISNMTTANLIRQSATTTTTAVFTGTTVANDVLAYGPCVGW